LCADKLFQNFNVPFTRDRFSYEKRADNVSAAYRNPSSNFRRMQWFLFTQMRIFGTPKSPVLFSDESIQVEMCSSVNQMQPTSNHSLSIIVRISFAKSNLCRTAFMGMA
ncbi:hypothetical protein AVEN_26966-1, partial [Araneus ventricosus]